MNSFLKTLVLGALALVSATVFAAVDVNKASQAELESIKGIGPAVSSRILDARKTSAFKDWGDLAQRVKGVGDRSATKFSAQGLTVNGATFDPSAGPIKTASARGSKADAKGGSKNGAKGDAKASSKAVAKKA